MMTGYTNTREITSRDERYRERERERGDEVTYKYKK